VQVPTDSRSRRHLRRPESISGFSETPCRSGASDAGRDGRSSRTVLRSNLSIRRLHWTLSAFANDRDRVRTTLASPWPRHVQGLRPRVSANRSGCPSSNRSSSQTRTRREGFHLWFDDQSEARAHTVVSRSRDHAFLRNMPPGARRAGRRPRLSWFRNTAISGRFRGVRSPSLGGASAIDLSALLHEGGARVTVVRAPQGIEVRDPPP